MADQGTLMQLCHTPESLGETVRVVVGCDDGEDAAAEVLYLPLNLLTANSPVFAAMFQNEEYVEARQRSVNLPQFAPEDFKQFIELLFASGLADQVNAFGERAVWKCPDLDQVPRWLEQVMPLVSYFQCDAARQFLVAQIEEVPSLDALAAFESKVTPGEIPQWSLGMINTIAVSCLEKENAIGKRPCLFCGTYCGKPGCGSTRTWICGPHDAEDIYAFGIKTGALPSLEKLSSKTLARIFTAAVALMHDS